MRILLVYPAFPSTFWSFTHALKFIRKRASLPPLGLLTVAAMLPPEWEKRLVDVNVQRLTDADLRWADAVFVSGMHVQRRQIDDIRRSTCASRRARSSRAARRPASKWWQEGRSL